MNTGTKQQLDQLSSQSHTRTMFGWKSHWKAISSIVDPRL